MSVLQKLTEGIVSRDVSKESKTLTEKWENTGLLEGLSSDQERESMSCLLENQAKEILREANSMGAGAAVEGFASVAFPIVRRVFGGLLANDLVSVQPMSLPSGLIFFLDFTTNPDSIPDTTPPSPFITGFDVTDEQKSLYGGVDGLAYPDGPNAVVAKGVAGGVVDTEDTGFYDLNTGYSNGRAVATPANQKWELVCDPVKISASTNGLLEKTGSPAVYTAKALAAQREIQHDKVIMDLAAEAPYAGALDLIVIKLSNCQDASTFASNTAEMTQFAQGMETSFTQQVNNGYNVRRLTQCTYTADGLLDTIKVVHISMLGSSPKVNDGATLPHAEAGDKLGHTGGDVFTTPCSFAIADKFKAATATGGVVGAPTWALEDQPMPEIDIKVDSIAITAQTKKLKAKWTPELGQDLNSYHNLDAEVELTNVLSEQIALEIDKEILNDLLQGAVAGTSYWSKLPGQRAGSDGSTTTIDFTGNVSEWYETLVETINDVSAQIHRKTLRGGANFLVCGPEVANILEFTSGFRASVTHDADRGTVGTYKNGSINKKWDLYVDPYFPRNSILVGRKGSSFLDSGYVYAPYVPLQTTPTIFDADTLTPRKGVMTRYGKKMVRADMYGVVLVRDM